MHAFDRFVEYPDIGSCEQILPLGELWLHVSSSFASGLLNYSTPVAAWVVFDDGDDGNDIRSRIDVFNTTSAGHHTDLDRFRWADVLMLSRSLPRKHSDVANDTYWFFDLCQDTSDCHVGRFLPPALTQQELVSLFDVFVAERATNERRERLQLDVSKIVGWMKFKP